MKVITLEFSHINPYNSDAFGEIAGTSVSIQEAVELVMVQAIPAMRDDIRIKLLDVVRNATDEDLKHELIIQIGN